MSKRHVVGIDEVGRGPLAGPVAVAALAAPASLKFKVKGAGFFKEIKDSKKLSAKKREEWFLRIKKNRNLKYAVSFVSPSVIDKRGISFALRLAVKRCSKKFPDYSFEIHKGYGTRLHCELIKKHGLSEIHRQSFCTRLV